MALPGETIKTGAPPFCDGGRKEWESLDSHGRAQSRMPPAAHPLKPMTPRVFASLAGFYVGTECQLCGPYTRESGYYKTEGEAWAALRTGEYGR